jgi:hypothetical protein
MSFAQLEAMPRLATALALVLFAAACTTTTTDPSSDPASVENLTSDERSMLGSYELNVSGTPGGGGFSARVRVDFVAYGGKLVSYVQGPGFGIPFTKTSLSLASDRATLEFPVYTRTVTMTVARTTDGKPSSASISGSPYGGTQTYTGNMEADITAPSLSYQETIVAPWEVGSLPFSEAMLAKDIVLPVSGSAEYTLGAIPDSPWIGTLQVRRPLSSTWGNGKPDPSGQGSVFALDGLSAKDPSGNALTESVRSYQTLQVGPAVRGYDFSKDTPAYPLQVNRLVTDCDAGAPACLRVSQGSKMGLRIAAGSKNLKLRYALRAGQFEGVAPKSTVNLTLFVAPGDASPTSTTKPIEVTWTPTPNPTETRAFATAYADLVIPLPKVEAETGITLYFDGEPRTTDVPVDGTQPFPGQVVTLKARHMVLLLQSATAE